MRLSSPSPPQTPVPTTTLDEFSTASLKSQILTIEHAMRLRTDSPSPPSRLSASPASPIASSHHSTISTSSYMSAIHSTVQPNSSSQTSTPASISIDNNSCLTLPDPASRRDPPVKIPSQSLDSGTVDPVSLPTKSRHSITPSFSFPSTSNSSATHDCIFPNSADSHRVLTTTTSLDSISTTLQQTPNVYINGLPPHSSEQDLFALARPFGDIKSVRTFTRHVSEKPTGYGFVLFSDVKSAQRCIEGLRKHRNLHPSFSKQVHRIPGTEYAQHNSVQSTDQDENSFKMRMEKLRDVTSTNLYIEGLPLSIDEESLTALMLPFKVKSSRFFKTKLSSPPRIIAFVRLETRRAAEETIERLHGRMVRGWNDPGCRISVRFADSAEQRELRRAERSLKNGDQSPSRLTIAQAALLNLRGQELQANVHDVTRYKPQRLADSGQDNLTTVRDSGLLPTSRSLPSKLCYTHREPPPLTTSDFPSTSEMDTLLQSIQNGYEDGSLDNAIRSLTLDNEYLMTQQAQLRALASAALLSPNPLPITLPRGHAQARNGFTPAEELILEAHAQRLQLHARLLQPSPIFDPMSASAQPFANGRSPESTVHELRQAPGFVVNGAFCHGILPTISEDDFRAMDHSGHSLPPTSHTLQGSVSNPSIPTTTSTTFVRAPSRAVSIVPPPPDYEEPGKRPKNHHLRSIGSKQISYPSSSFNNRQSNESKSRPALSQASTIPNIGSNGNNRNASPLSSGKNNELQHTYTYSHADASSCPEEERVSPFRSSLASRVYTKRSPKLSEQHSTVKEGLKSPCVVSPALTYSSRTPSTLSPATPFFGSFAGSQDAFEVMMMENEDAAERKLEARVANK